jgi:hypothetical protein
MSFVDIAFVNIHISDEIHRKAKPEDHASRVNSSMTSDPK